MESVECESTANCGLCAQGFSEVATQRTCVREALFLNLIHED
jgi:hypothetical protein